jgi:peptide-methionine (S)-S-oxide reductase
MPGVVRTRVGYAGGTTKDPTYHNLGDHSETIQIEYDPEQVSYEELLDVFWSSHDPSTPAWSRQYMSIIFYHDDEQRRLAMETRDRQAAALGSEIVTEIVPAAEFYPAEAYHQKYRLRQTPALMAEFEAIYPDEADFVASTAAARVNSYLGGNGTCDGLQAESGELGLSSEGVQRLVSRVCR